MRGSGSRAGALIVLAALAACRERAALSRVVTSAGAAGGAAVAGPDRPGGRLSFISERDGGREVYLIGADGQGERRLTAGTRDAAHYNGPAAPGGAALLVLSVEGGRQRLAEHPLGGTGANGDAAPRPLAAAGLLRGPSWSPDGRWLVLESDAGGFRDLYRVSREGGLRRLTANPEGNFEPAVSPRGDAIAFVSSRDRVAELYRMRPDGGDVQRLTRTARDEWAPRWSPDGALLCFGSDREGADRLYVMPAGGGEARRVSNEGGEVRTVEEAHAWAPAGLRLAYVRRRPGEPGRILIADLASGARAELRAPDGAEAAEPAWSPDGSWLAFSASRDGESQIYTARADGSGGARLTRGPGPIGARAGSRERGPQRR